MSAADDAPRGVPGPEELIDRLMGRVAEEQERLARVVEHLPGVVGTASETELAQGITDIARDVCDAVVALYVGEGDEPPVVTVDARAVVLPQVDEAPLLSAARRAEEVLAVDDVLAVSSEAGVRAYGAVDDGRPLRSWLAAPVVSAPAADAPDDPGGRRRGTLLVGHSRPHAFDARHHRLLAGVARHLAAALEGAALVDEHVRLATGLSETLLPPLLPQIDGADVASRYRPAGEASRVGGDFYDVFPSGDGRWVVAIGDVCGVGPEAAAVTGIARYTLRAVAREDAAPARALAALNDAILAHAVDSRFCTAVVAAVEPGRPAGRWARVAGRWAGADTPPDGGRGGLRVRWSNGGHPAPLVLRDDGTVEQHDRHLGPLLGVMADAAYEEAGLDLQAGDALLLYTDGVIEARPPGGDFFGEDRLAEVLATCAGRTADGIARRVELAVIDHLGGLPDDDLAILVLRARHAPSP